MKNLLQFRLPIIFTIFSMFFGAGNSVFPLTIGVNLGAGVHWGVVGLLLSGILLPLIGVLSVVFQGGSLWSVLSFFGKVPGLCVSLILVLLLGPIATLPRCVNIAFLSMSPYVPGVSLGGFSLALCLLTYFCSINPKYITSILGKLLSPILVACLICIIIFGFDSLEPVEYGGAVSAVSHGFKQGYHTLDLLAGLFFAPTIWRMHLRADGDIRLRDVIANSAVSFFILALIYWGLARTAAGQTEVLAEVEMGALLSKLADYSLGPLGGFIANIAVCLACFTTMVGLSVTLVEWVVESWPTDSLERQKILFFVMTVTCGISMLGFSVIMELLGWILFYLYPLLIALSVYVLLRSFYNYKLQN